MQDILKFKNYIFGLLLLLALVTFLLASAVTKRSAMQELRVGANHALGIYKTNLENEISNYESMPRLFARAPLFKSCLLYTSPSPRDATLSRMPSSA